jgi:hypothetical protein
MVEVLGTFRQRALTIGYDEPRNKARLVDYRQATALTVASEVPNL